VREDPTNESLCSRCALAEGCTIPDDSGRLILSCVRFEYVEPLFSEHTEDASSTSEKGSSRIDGLCVDCENRGSCVFRGVEGGVWHCEEYR